MTATAARAECEFPYYPEFADVFSKYDEVTPLLAKKFAMITAVPGVRVGAYICEPLLLRDVTGMPLYNVLTFYNGYDPGVARKWNEIIKTINARRKVSASDLGEKLKFFEDEKVLWQFKAATISAYTFGCGMIEGGGSPRPLRGYNAAYEKAAAVLKNHDLLFTRMISGGYHYDQYFEFESRSGKKVAILAGFVPLNDYPTEVADLDLLTTLNEISARSLYRTVGADPGRFEEKREWWKRIDESIPDERAGQELARVTEEPVFHVKGD
jgi:hypothetical protein